MPRRRRHSVLRALAGTVLLLALALAAAVAAALLLIDPDSLRPQIEAAALRSTGGTLALRGPLRLGLGLAPVLRADDVVLTANAGADTLGIAHLAAQIALLPLLAGTVDIVRLNLIGPVLVLAAVAPSPVPPPALPPSGAPAATAVAGGGVRLHLALRALHLTGGQVRWRGVTLGVPRLDAGAAAPGAALEIAGTLEIAGQTMQVSGEMGPAERLFDRDATTPFPLQLVLQAAAARLAVRGALAAPLRAGGYALQVDAAATDLAAFAPLLPLPPPKLHDLSLAARVAGTGRARPEISALTLHVGGLDLGAVLPGLAVLRADVTAPDLHQPMQVAAEATLHGTALHVAATVGPPGPPLPVAFTAEAPPALEHLRGAIGVTLAGRPRLVGTLAAGRLDLDALATVLPPRPAAAPAAAAPPLRADTLIPDTPLPLGPLRAADADLQITVAAMQDGGVAYSDLAAHLVMQDGRLLLDPLAARAPGGVLSLRLAVDAAAAVPPMALALHAPVLALAPLAAAFGDPGALDGTAAVDAALTAAGATPHALAASLGGHMTLHADDAGIDNALLAAALGGVLRAARLPEALLAGSGQTRLRCFDLRLDAADGTVTLTRLFADTPLLAVQGDGTIALGPEALNLHLRPLLRVGPGVVVPVRLGGTLRAPKPALDGGGGRLAVGAAPDDGCAAADATAPSGKPPKPLDILRGLLAH